MMESTPKKWNLNSFLTLGLGVLLSLGGEAMRSAIGKMSERVERSAESITRMEATQGMMQKQLGDIIPRAELEIRFKSFESQVIELRMRQQTMDLELIKLRDRKP